MRRIPIEPGNIYHIYNRGVNRTPIFFQKENWDYFIWKIYKYIKPPNARMIAYCLMPNHYHLLVQVEIEDFGQKIMRPFTIAYTKAINIQKNRVGHLFQGAYQTTLIKTDEDLLEVSRYIHLNPVKGGLVKMPTAWEYSSYLDYLGKRDSPQLFKEPIEQLFSGGQTYQEFVEND